MQILRRAASAALTFTLMLPLSSPAGLAAQHTEDVLIGNWQGSLDTGAAQLPLVFHVTRADDGSLTGSLDSPAQGAFGIPVTGISLDGATVNFEIAAVAGGFSGTLSEDGKSIAGSWNQGPASLSLTVTKGEGDGGATTFDRPQEPTLPLPYRSEEVAVPHEEVGVTLAGTLTLPEGPGPFPGVVLVSGSGPQDRDESLMGHRPFYVLSDHLTRNGIATLRYDDRGVAGSTGDFGSATTEDFTRDALAAVAYLRSVPEVDPASVGIAGHSEGGLIAPMAASRSQDVAFVVMLAGPGVDGAKILTAQGELIARAMGATEEAIALNGSVQRQMIDVVLQEEDPETAAPVLRSILADAVANLPPDMREAAEATAEAEIAQINTPWFRFFLAFDPAPALERVTVPVLALNGEKDLQVPWKENLQAIEEALARGGNADVTVRMLPRLNHLFQTAETGTPAEYATISETMSPTLLEAVSSWILERFPPLS